MDPETTSGTEIPSDVDPMAPDGMADGVLEGGWGYIWAAYVLTWTFLAGYAIYVTVRKTLSKRALENATE